MIWLLFKHTWRYSWVGWLHRIAVSWLVLWAMTWLTCYYLTYRYIKIVSCQYLVVFSTELFEFYVAFKLSVSKIALMRGCGGNWILSFRGMIIVYVMAFRIWEQHLMYYFPDLNLLERFFSWRLYNDKVWMKLRQCIHTTGFLIICLEGMHLKN